MKKGVLVSKAACQVLANSYYKGDVEVSDVSAFKMAETDSNNRFMQVTDAPIRTIEYPPVDLSPVLKVLATIGLGGVAIMITSVLLTHR